MEATRNLVSSSPSFQTKTHLKSYSSPSSGTEPVDGFLSLLDSSGYVSFSLWFEVHGFQFEFLYRYEFELAFSDLFLFLCWCFAVVMLHEQTTTPVVNSRHLNSLSRHFPASVLSQEPREESRPLSHALREDRTSQVCFIVAILS